jgi:hypothetical protein
LPAVSAGVGGFEILRAGRAQTTLAVAFMVGLPGEKLFRRYLITATDFLARDLACIDGTYVGSLAAACPSSDVFGGRFDHAATQASPAPDHPITLQRLTTIFVSNNRFLPFRRPTNNRGSLVRRRIIRPFERLAAYCQPDGADAAERQPDISPDLGRFRAEPDEKLVDVSSDDPEFVEDALHDDA